MIRIQLPGQTRLALMLGCLALAYCMPAAALPEYLQAAKTAYGFKAGGAVDSKACNLCHAGDTNKNSLNSFGKDLQAALKASADHRVTPALIRTLDSKDSDGDGWPNASEFAADTLPGDPASKPAGTPPGSVMPKDSTAAAAFNPFGLSSVLYPGHAQHPVLVHFPIALFIFSLFLDVMGLRLNNRALNSAAYLNLAAAAVTALASVVTGLLAWRFAFGGEPLGSDRWLLLHLVLGSVTAVLICALWAMRFRQLRRAVETAPGPLYVFLGVLTLALVSLTGHIGGVVSGIVK